MAVVTKAMGAFLVMMLLLLPYYSSGPVGQKAAEDLAAQVEQIQKDIQNVIDSLKTASPDDLRQKLEQALRELEEAQKLIAELKRDNDALNAQVKRLEDDKATLTAQMQQLQQQLASVQQERDALKNQVAQLQKQVQDLQQDLDNASQGVLMGQVTNLSCPADIYLVLGAFPVDGPVIGPDHVAVKYPLDMFYSLGNVDYGAGKLGKETSVMAFPGFSVGTYVIIVQARSTTRVAKRPVGDIHILQKPATACTGQLMLEMLPKQGGVSVIDVVAVSIDPGNYVSVVGDLVATDKSVTLNGASAVSLNWVRDQLAHAEKVP